MGDAQIKKLYTTHEVAKFLGVTPITVIRWIESGKFKCYTTVGGHRRIDHEELVQFAHQYNLPWKGEEDLKKRKEFVVLAVDDEPEILELIQDMLSDLTGIQLIEASNGFAAGAKLVEECPNLILLDFMMPELDGFEFSKFVKQDPRFKDIPIVAVTGLRGLNEKEKMMQSGVQDILFKPFGQDQLVQMIERFRNHREGGKAAA